MKRILKILSVTVTLYLFSGYSIYVFSIDGPKDIGTSACETYIIISGESNVNKFSFKYIAPSFAESNNTARGAEIEISGLLIPVRNFRPSNPKMYDDFLSMLKADEFPFIEIVLHRSDFSIEKASSSHTPQRISVTIAGVTRDYDVSCSLIYCYDSIILKGRQTIKLTDFELQPPVKLSGLVRVHDEINVSFGFILNFTGEHAMTVLK